MSVIQIINWGVEMFVHRAWYRAAWSKELKKKPMHRKFLMQDVALYRDSKGKAHALNAMCPHRGANLGEGEVVGDCLQCPFHGLLFNADGHCEKMPFQPDNRPILKQARVTSYPVREQDGIIWIWMDTETKPHIEPDRFAWLDLAAGNYRIYGKTDLIRGSYLMNVETAIDDTHVPFVHRSTLARFFDQGASKVPRQKIMRHADDMGFTCQLDPASSWWPDGSPGDTPAEQIPEKLRKLGTLERSFRLGGQVIYEDENGGDAGEFAAFVTPMDEYNTWFSVASVINKKRNGFLKSLGWWLLLSCSSFADRVLGEDRDANSSPLIDHPGNLANPVMFPVDNHLVEFKKLWFEALKREGREPPPAFRRPTPWNKKHVND